MARRMGRAQPMASTVASPARACGRRAFLLSGLALVACLAAAPVSAPAAGGVPVRVRVIKGARQGPPSVDPRLSDLKGQLGQLAYQRWAQVGERRAEMEPNGPISLTLPDGAQLELTLVDARKELVTFELRVQARRIRSRLTISRGQRIVQQVTDEKAGEAYFVAVRPWP
jgi:hypothetical protein